MKEKLHNFLESLKQLQVVTYIGSKILWNQYCLLFQTIKVYIIAPQRRLYLITASLDLVLASIIILNSTMGPGELLSPVTDRLEPLHPLTKSEGNLVSGKQVFGFAPFWTIDKLDGVDFDTLTTVAYFGVPVLPSGNLDRQDFGYTTFKSRKATSLFRKAHASGTKVVLTLTQMENWKILSILDNEDAVDNAISQAVDEVEKRGIDGINVDFEYNGDPGNYYRQRYTDFVAKLTEEMHRSNPNSQVTVSVYAASVKDPKIYDVGELAKVSDGIFMMAYDFATVGSDNAIPTSPLYGYKEGKYWYDVSTAVDDFLAVMPGNKLILGVPWYGYNYLVYEPKVKAETRPSYTWRGKPASQPYALAKEHIRPDMANISDFIEGWDDVGKVGWKAYYRTDTDTWRMLFLEDVNSLGIKYDFAKNKDLAGVGVWALGFDDNQKELWDLLKQKFGSKTPDHSLIGKVIAAEDNYE